MCQLIQILYHLKLNHAAI
ncbi:hypothetical protein BpHYR1_044059 [Brachionus plicatilis]|uniref:Uncharacterized protein n=1 Tax=Brachionus plicatilis TaxID=10195 RepID=A0A3M7RS13_BRAPC|nr:hypothetical protein BpHYR1_044059 [Brachionus plicatilis]